jgi:conjugal transfer pilus assembly protein TraE
VDERLPQFLHRPVQILWFDSQEFIVVMSTIFVAVIVGGIIGWRSSALFSSSFPGSGPSRAGSSRIWPGAGALPASATIRVRPRPASSSRRDGTSLQTQAPGRHDRRTRPSWHLHRYLQGSANLFEENRLLKVAIAGLFGITAVLGTVIYTSNQNTRTVVVPFGADGDLYVTGNKPSEAISARSPSTSSALPAPIRPIRPTGSSRSCCGSHPSAYNGLRDSLNRCSTSSATIRRFRATYIRGDQPVTWTGSEILVPVEKVRVIGGVIRKFRAICASATRSRMAVSG